MKQNRMLKLFISFTVFASLLLTGCNLSNIKDGKETIKATNNETNSQISDVTMYEFASFLSTKNEHYPMSDEFIERYQQKSGGYIDYAESLGMEVNRAKHLPDQKFHFFDSWYIRSIDDGSLSYTDSAKNRVYQRLLCPELLLWIYEASGVEPVKVREAMKIAEAGKVSKENLTSTASKMRKVVAWEDFQIDTNTRMANSVNFENTAYEVHLGEELEISALVSPTDTTETPTWTIIDGNEFIDINPNNSKCIITPKSIGTATIEVQYSKYASAKTTINVLEAKHPMIESVPALIDLDINNKYKVSPKLNIGQDTFTYEIADKSIASITDDGLITAKSYGTTTLTIKGVSDPTLIKEVTIDVSNHGSKVNPLSVLEAKTLIDKYNKISDGTTTSEVYISGKVTSLNRENNSFILEGLENATDKLNVENYITETNINEPSNNDEIKLKGHISYKDNSLLVLTPSIYETIRGLSTVAFTTDKHATVYINEVITTTIDTENGSTITFKVIPETGRKISSITINDIELTLNETNTYTYVVDGPTNVVISTIDPSAPTSVVYDVIYDLGTRKTAKLLESTDEVLNTLVNSNDSTLINGITSINYIYGGGNGGRGATNWYTGNMLKLGTTKLTGDLTISLSSKVNKIIITGYATDTSAKLRVGDSNSTDWNGTLDSKTTEVTCSNMNLSNKANVEAGTTSTLEITFAATNTLKIATTKAQPVYITAIEFFIA